MVNYSFKYSSQHLSTQFMKILLAKSIIEGAIYEHFRWETIFISQMWCHEIWSHSILTTSFEQSQNRTWKEMLKVGRLTLVWSDAFTFVGCYVVRLEATVYWVIIKGSYLWKAKQFFPLQNFIMLSCTCALSFLIYVLVESFADVAVSVW